MVSARTLLAFHEAAHALAVYLIGRPICSVSINTPDGGEVRWVPGSCSPKERAFVSAAGPMVENTIRERGAAHSWSKGDSAQFAEAAAVGKLKDYDVLSDTARMMRKHWSVIGALAEELLRVGGQLDGPSAEAFLGERLW